MRRVVSVFLVICFFSLSLPQLVTAQNGATAFDRALFYFTVGRWDSVTNELNNALKEQQNDPEVLLFIGVFLSSLGDETQATTFLAKAEKAAPRTGVLVLQGDIYRRMKNIKKAEEYYKKALKTNPNTVMAHIGIGNIEEINKRYNEALNAYLKALEINPDRVETLIDAGRMEILLNKVESAVTHFSKAVEIDSGSAENHLWYAKALYMSGVSDKALQQIERTLELDPTNIEAQELKQKWQI